MTDARPGDGAWAGIRGAGLTHRRSGGLAATQRASTTSMRSR